MGVGYPYEMNKDPKKPIESTQGGYGEREPASNADAQNAEAEIEELEKMPRSDDADEY